MLGLDPKAYPMDEKPDGLMGSMAIWVFQTKGRFCLIPPRYQQDMVRGTKKGARWEEIINRWPFRKEVDHNRAHRLLLRYILPRVSLVGLPEQAVR
jgi:hypothetical protein